MADESDQSQKTEQPTQRKLDEAVEHGDVTQSPDIVAWAILAGATALFAMWAAQGASDLAKALKRYLSESGAEILDPKRGMLVAQDAGLDLLSAVALPFALIVAIAIGAHLLQRPFIFSAEKIQPNAGRINPLSGFNRLFGRIALLQFAKGLIKITAVAVATSWVLWPERLKLAGLVDVPLLASLNHVHLLVVRIMVATLTVFGVIAALDFAWQYFERRQRLMMSRQELKDEFKQAEGDPHIKAKLRQIRSDRARIRMMAAVPKATVVITNPTHYAVALAYESGVMAAPVVVAKGLDHVALKIRAIAEENKVPVVENPPLARTLYATVDIDEPVKAEHYKAVAQVIGYVMRLRQGSASRR